MPQLACLNSPASIRLPQLASTRLPQLACVISQLILQSWYLFPCVILPDSTVSARAFLVRSVGLEVRSQHHHLEQRHALL